MTHWTRRRFLASLGLGAGASLLLPVSDRLISQAMGVETNAPKRLVLLNVYMFGGVLHRPAETDGISTSNSIAPLIPKSWPDVFNPIAGHMDRAIMIDGMRNHINDRQHRCGTSALSCVAPTEGKVEKMGPSGGPTIDQHIAKTLSKSSAHNSVIWGLSGDGVDSGARTGSGLFASSRGQNLSHFAHAGQMMDSLFPDPQGGANPTNSAPSFRPLRDRLLGDLNKLKSKLAAEERAGLESYEKAILDFDQRQEALGMLSCEAPGTAAETKDAQDQFDSMMQQSLLALQCGLTNVVAISIGHSHNHNKHMPAYREVVARSKSPDAKSSGKVTTYGHGTDTFRLEAIKHLHQLHFKGLNTLMNGLANQKEQDGSSALDHTAAVYSTGNGSQGKGGAWHHAGSGSKDNWPALLLAGKETGFKTGGRFMSCSIHEHKGEKWNLSDFYRTLAHGLGVNPNGYGDKDHTNGLMQEILT